MYPTNTGREKTPGAMSEHQRTVLEQLAAEMLQLQDDSTLVANMAAYEIGMPEGTSDGPQAATPIPANDNEGSFTGPTLTHFTAIHRPAPGSALSNEPYHAGDPFGAQHPTIPTPAGYIHYPSPTPLAAYNEPQNTILAQRNSIVFEQDTDPETPSAESDAEDTGLAETTCTVLQREPRLPAYIKAEDTGLAESTCTVPKRASRRLATNNTNNAEDTGLPEPTCIVRKRAPRCPATTKPGGTGSAESTCIARRGPTTPQQFPTPTTAEPGVHIAPGFWAEFLEDSSLIRKSLMRATTQGTLINAIKSAPVVREPTVRAGKSWNGEYFRKQVFRCPTNLESLQIQAKGRALSQEEACDHCKKARGVFSTCVVYDGGNGAFPSCGNCTWSRQSERCSFHKAAVKARTEALLKAHSASFVPLVPVHAASDAVPGLAVGQSLNELQTSALESREGMEAVSQVLLQEEAAALTQLRGLESSLLNHLGEPAMMAQYELVRALVVQSEARREQLRQILNGFGPGG